MKKAIFVYFCILLVFLVFQSGTMRASNLGALLLLTAMKAVVPRPNNDRRGVEIPGDFDYFVLAMEYPRGYCAGDFGGKTKCVVPKHT